MPVQTVDMKFYITGGLGNLLPNNSLGGARSNTVQVGNSINSLFDNISGANHTAGKTDTGQTYDYRVIAFRLDNPLASGTGNLTNAVLKKVSENLGDCGLEFHVSPTVNTQYTAGINENTAPTQGGPLTFSSIPIGGLALPTTIAPGDEVHIAIRRKVNSGSTGALNNFVLQISGDN